MIRCLLWSLLLALMLTSCVDLSVNTRKQSAQTLVMQAGWNKQTLQTAYFPLLAYMPDQKVIPELTVYIEGDGLAWVSRSQPSSDPTPMNPLALKLALADSRQQSAYLARPCQFVRNDRCERRYWTSARFAPEVIDAMDDAVSQLKAQFHAQKLKLVGYSGGGAVAALVAARRHDVVQLVTVAGNLDHEAWTNLQHISPLTESLNAADFWQRLVDIPQMHFVGANDRTVPYAVAASYQARFPRGHRPEIKVVDGADHHCCWVKQWPDLIEALK